MMQDPARTGWAQVERHEMAAVAWAFAWLFFALLGYYVLRPVRDTLVIAGNVRDLRWLFLATFLTMLAAVPVYSFVVARLRRRALVTAVYCFFILDLIIFWLLMRSDQPVLAVWGARVFFVWMGIFSLFSVSIFWSFLADVFSSEQGGRLFGLIASGGTLGALLGSFVAAQSVARLGVANLLVIPIILLGLACCCAWRLDRVARQFDREPESDAATGPQAIGGGILTGFTRAVRSRYLFGISGYLFLATFLGTIIYCQQAEIVKAAIPDAPRRTQLFANINLAVQIITFGLQTLATAHLVRRLGLAVTLCILPCLCLIGFIALGMAPILMVLVVVEVARRAAIYAIAEPARNVLFTVVSREDKYKTKGFIDTVVFRGGDAVAGQVFSGLRGLGLGLAAVAWLMVPVAALWGLLGWSLGRQHRRRAQKIY
jgi:AAA family ATP:ADP antiporter